MSSKAILRLLIGCILAGLFLIILLPAINIPKSYLLPPPLIYPGAKGHSVALVDKKNTGANPNPFRNSETVYYVTYRFKAPVPTTMLEKVKPEETDKKRIYGGRAVVDQSFYDSIKTGDTVPIRFEESRPDINGIDKPGGGPNDQGGAALGGSWLLFVLGILVLGYIIAPFLQRIMLREDY